MVMTRSIVAAVALVLSAAGAFAAGGEIEIKRNKWTFGGLFGHYDQAQLQRGFQIYREVCASCHGLDRIAFRNLVQPGGPAFPKDAVEALAKEYEVDAEPNDEGEHEDKVVPANPLTQQQGAQQQNVEGRRVLEEYRVCGRREFVSQSEEREGCRIGHGHDQGTPGPTPSGFRDEQQNGDPGDEAAKTRELPTRQGRRLDRDTPGREEQRANDEIEPGFEQDGFQKRPDPFLTQAPSGSNRGQETRAA